MANIMTRGRACEGHDRSSALRKEYGFCDVQPAIGDKLPSSTSSTRNGVLCLPSVRTEQRAVLFA